MDPAFLSAWDAVCKSMSERHEGQAMQACDAAIANPNLAAHKAMFSRFRRDITDYLGARRKARDRLVSLIGSPAPVMLTSRETGQRTPCRIIAPMPGNAGVRARQEPGNREFDYPFREMAAADILELSEVSNDRDKGDYLAAAVSVLRREESSFASALGTFRRLAGNPHLGGDAREYAFLIELEGERMMRQWADAFGAFRSEKDPKRKSALAASLEQLTQRLKASYSGTLAYRKISR